jgi:hypothetical protein
MSDNTDRKLEKSFHSVVNLLKWMNAFDEDCKKSIHVDYDDDYCLIFTGTVEEPKEKKPVKLIPVDKKEIVVDGRRFKVTVEEYTDKY